MNEAPRLQNSKNEPLPPSQNNELNEIAWQKWIERNKDRDAAYRKNVLVACRCGLCLAAHGEQVVSKPAIGAVRKWAKATAKRNHVCSNHIKTRPEPTPMRLRAFGGRWVEDRAADCGGAGSGAREGNRSS